MFSITCDISAILADATPATCTLSGLFGGQNFLFFLHGKDLLRVWVYPYQEMFWLNFVFRFINISDFIRGLLIGIKI